MRGEPEEIPDAEYEQVVERARAIDVAKESGKVCTRLPRESAPDRRVSKVWDVKATTNAIVELGGYLVGQGIEKGHRRVDVRLLADLVLPAGSRRVGRATGQRPGGRERAGQAETDKIDAVWLARLTEKGLLRPSFVPPAEIRVLRDYTRLRLDLTQERTRHWQRLEKLLEDSLTKVSSVASRLDTMSTRDMLEALIRGERDPRKLADLARGKMRAKHAALVEALTGRFDAHHGELARMPLDQIDALTRQIDTLTTRIDTQIATIPAAAPAHAQGCDNDGDGDPPSTGHAHRPPARLSALRRLDEIPGVGPHTAQVISPRSAWT